MKYKTLSIVFPGGSKIASGEKTIEVRSWQPPEDFKGDLLIVENKRFLRNEGEIDPEGIPIAIVKIKKVRAYEEADIAAACACRWEPGYFSWDLTDIRPINIATKVHAARGIYETELPLIPVPLMTSKKAYYSSLPRKRSAVGVLIIQNEKILTFEPTYKPNWLVPGGVVEKFESPLEAAIREAKEELGLEVKITNLLCVDYKKGNEETGDAVHFLFMAEAPTEEIRIDEKKIKSYQLLSIDNALKKFDHHLASRVRCGLEAIQSKKTIYCEDGQPVL